jgi:hypothetical protein
MENQSPAFGFNVLRIFDSVFFVEEAHDPKKEDVQISYAMAIHPDIEESWVQFNIRVDFSTADIKVFATGTVITKFGVTNLKQFVKDDYLVWPANVLETMFSISFTHTRALLAKNMAPTRFSDYIVPLINHIPLFNELMKTQQGFEGAAKIDTEKPKSAETIDRETPNARQGKKPIPKIKKKPTQ